MRNFVLLTRAERAENGSDRCERPSRSQTTSLCLLRAAKAVFFVSEHAAAGVGPFAVKKNQLPHQKDRDLDLVAVAVCLSIKLRLAARHGCGLRADTAAAGARCGPLGDLRPHSALATGRARLHVRSASNAAIPLAPSTA